MFAGRRGYAFALAVLLLNAASIRGADWDQWRGPNRDGHVANLQAPDRWPEKLSRRWRVDVGTGHSAPLLVGGAVFQHARQGDDEVVMRLDPATGADVWRDAYPAPYEMHSAARSHGKGPKSTPVHADGRVFTFGISGILSCIDAQSGKPLWRKEFSKQFKKTSPLYGTAMSPLVDRGLLIAHVGGHDAGALIAFDVETGAVRWHWDGDGPGYASPIIVEAAGKRQVVTQTQNFCVGVAVDSGELLWKIPFKTPYDQNSITPITHKDLIIFGGTRQPTFAIRLWNKGGILSPETVWETRDATLYMSTPVVADRRVLGSRVFGMSEQKKGQLFGLDPKTGSVEWTGAGRFGSNAVLLDAGPWLLALNTDAELSVFEKRGFELRPTAKYRVADRPVWATPAVAGNRLLVKDEKTLTLWEIAQ